MNRSAREGKSVKRFGRSNGPDIALYKKNYVYIRSIVSHIRVCSADESSLGRAR